MKLELQPGTTTLYKQDINFQLGNFFLKLKPTNRETFVRRPMVFKTFQWPSHVSRALHNCRNNANNTHRGYLKYYNTQQNTARAWRMRELSYEPSSCISSAMEALSVSIIAMASPSSILSPTFISHLQTKTNHKKRQTKSLRK